MSTFTHSLHVVQGIELLLEGIELLTLTILFKLE